MYAVIRAGGKQYRVAPGDVIRIEKIAPASDRSVEFRDVMLVSPSEGQVSRPDGARVTGRVVEEGRGENPHVLNWPRLSWYSLRPDLFTRWFFRREAMIPSYPLPADHGFFTNQAFLTEWSHIPVVVATPP